MNNVNYGNPYSNTTDLFEAEFGPLNDEEKTAYQAENARMIVSQTLFEMRNHKKKSQEDVAKSMGVSKGKVVKLESYGAKCSLEDMLIYANALGYKAEISFFPLKTNDAQRIEFYLRDIITLMERLKKLAGDDIDIQKGVLAKFMNEVGSMLSEVLPDLVEKIAKSHIESESAERSESTLSISVNTPATEKPAIQHIA